MKSFSDDPDQPASIPAAPPAEQVNHTRHVPAELFNHTRHVPAVLFRSLLETPVKLGGDEYVSVVPAYESAIKTTKGLPKKAAAAQAVAAPRWTREIA